MSETVKDDKGRMIEVKEVVGSALSRMTRAAGEAWGQNEWTIATMARATVRSIDGVPLPPLPNKLEEMDLLWDKVDPAATAAAMDWIIDRQQKVLADAKNSQGHPDSENASSS